MTPGQFAHFTAVAIESGAPSSSPITSWSSSDDAVLAFVETEGATGAKFECVAPGTATVSAVVGGVTGTSEPQVVAEIESVTVSLTHVTNT